MTTHHKDIAILTAAMKLAGWLNAGQGVLNLALYCATPLPPPGLLLTDLLACATWVLVYLKLHFMMHTRNWLELSLTAMCGLYMPLIVLTFSHMQFISAL